MTTIEKSSIIKAPRAEVFEFFLDPNNLSKVSPPQLQLEGLKTDVPLKEGSEFSFRAKSGLFRFRWRGRVVKLEAPRIVIDEQIEGPFQSFRHVHLFRDLVDHTMVIDLVEYKPSFGVLGRLINVMSLQSRMEQMLEYRHARLKELFAKKKPAQH